MQSLCECGRCGPRCGRAKCVCLPTITEKRTRCGSVTRKIGTYHVGHVEHPICTTTTTTVLPQVYMDYSNMCEIWYPPNCGTIEVTKINSLTYQIGIPDSMRGKLRVIIEQY